MTYMRSRGLLALATIAIGFAAADTYVVILALPAMMTSAGLGVADISRAAPIVSGFLLGYVAVLPLIGRISDVRGRVPVMIGSLALFAIGSVVTAVGFDLTSIVAGRFLQGIGGGGLIPPTLALVADQWPAERRGLPLGVVGAVQELGSVAGPLYGAAVLAFGSWRNIFWLNCAVGLILAAAMMRFREEHGRTRLDVAGIMILSLAVTAGALTVLKPSALATGVTTGLAWVPVTGQSVLLTPIALTAIVSSVVFVAQQAATRNSLLRWRTWSELGRQTDLIGASLLTVGLGCVIVTFSTADPETATFDPGAMWPLSIALFAFVGFVTRQSRASYPLIPRGALKNPATWGALVVSFFIGAALIAALVDVPFFARLTVSSDSQFGAAMILLWFLVALPIGAIAGGWLLRFLRPAPLTSTAMAVSAAMFAVMSRWDAQALESQLSMAVLAACGFGFGVAVAPVNAALLNNTENSVHGVASALLIVARMIGMLIGISLLTTWGMRAFHREVERLPSVEELCGQAGTACAAYESALIHAGISQLNAVFAGAFVCATAAAVTAAVVLRQSSTPSDSVSP